MRVARFLKSVASEYIHVVRVKVKRQVLRYQNPDLVIGYNTIIRYDTLMAINIGPNVTIGPFCEIVALERTRMSPVRGRLAIAAHSVIGAFANIRAAGGIIEIGPYALIAQHVTIVAANHALRAGEFYCQLPYDQERTGVRIGSNVWIGAGVCIMPGSSVGDNSVIAAGAVVTKDVPPNELWGGIPARRMRELH